MELSDEKIGSILSKYKLTLDTVLARQSGYRNKSHIVKLEDSSKLNLIVYKSEPGIVERIKRANRLSTSLANSKLPIRIPLSNKIIEIKSAKTVHYASIYNYLGGDTIEWEAYSMKHIKLLGWTMAEFHNQTADYAETLPDISTENYRIIDRMLRYFAKQTVKDASLQKLKIKLTVDFDDLRELVGELDQTNIIQPLHLDFVRGNILFDKSSEHHSYKIGSIAVSGIIDLEKASFGHPVWDVGRTLAFLIVDCPKPTLKLFKYFVQSGYQKRGGRPGVLPHLEQVIGFYLLYDLYKFLRDNPYEDLEQNHHYKQTRNELAMRNMLQYK
ncbi:hypothetical protein EOM60_03285 [Candidatus Saccharibacteria bacterium]|nr:hypothetical protein [Candidatus Saccharibacteria bacterium]